MIDLSEEKEIKKDLDVDSQKEESNLDMNKLKVEAEVFLNDFNNNIPNSMSGIGSFIRKDETSETWFFSETEEELKVNYALLIKQLAEYLDVNMFELLLEIQLKLTGVYTEEYMEFKELIDSIDDSLNEDTTTTKL